MKFACLEYFGLRHFHLADLISIETEFYTRINYLTGASNKTTIKAIKIAARYNKEPRANQVSRFVLLTTLILFFLCFIAITRCLYLAAISIGQRNEKGITSLE